MQREAFLIPGSSGEIRAQRDSRPWAWWSDSSVLSFKTEESRATEMPIMAWAGSLGELEGGGLFDDDPRTWGPKGWAAMESACGRLAEAGRRLILRPHHRHVLSDVPSCKRFAESSLGASGVRLALDPVSMCTECMQEPGTFQDHLGRLFQATETFPAGSLAAVVVPLRHQQNSVIMGLVEGHIPPVVPLVLSP